MEGADGVEVEWREPMVWRRSGGSRWCVGGVEGADGVEVEWRELMVWRWCGGS